jgi:outer membrane autotransporter protein
MRKPRTKTRTWHDYNLVKRGAITLGSSVFATQAVAVPPVVFSYETLNFGDTNTFLTGIRGNIIVGNYVIPGTTETGGLSYDMTTGLWTAMPVATENGANYPDAIGSSPYGPSFGNPGGILRVVGSYQTAASAPYDLSYLYDAAAPEGQTLTTLVFPSGEDETLYTIAHSTFGNQLVGNYDTRLATGNAFIYNIDTGVYTTNNIPGAISTTAYGIYGDMIAGGYGAVMIGDGIHAEHGYIYNQITDTYVTYDHPGAVATHFEGITGAGRSGEYNLVTNWVTADGTVHPAVMHLDALGVATWYEIDIPGAVVSSNSAYGDYVIGIYVNENGNNGYLATLPGMYNPIRNDATLSFGTADDAALSGRKGDDIVNAGTIAATGNGGIGMRGETYGVLTNTGTVTASGIAGAAVELHGLYGTLLNYGTLQTTAASDALRTGPDSYGSTIVNMGIIDGRLAATAGPDKRFENSGWLGVSGTGIPITHLLSGVFVQTTVGTYAARIAEAGSDALEVTGTARLAGALQATFLSSSFAPTTTLIAATQGITGTFDSFVTVGLPALFDAVLTYDATTLTMTVSSDLTNLPDLTQNQNAVAAALDGIINTQTDGMLTSLPDGLSALYGLTSAELPGALSVLSGEGYASEQTILIGDSLYTRQAILGRLRQASYGPTDNGLAALSFGGPSMAIGTSGGGQWPAPTTVWGQAYGGRAALSDGNALSDINENFGGLIAGIDTQVDTWVLGAAIGYTQSNSNMDALSTTFEVDSLLLAAYAGTSVGPWNIRLGASQAYNQISADRSIVFPGENERAQAGYDGTTTQLFAEAAYGFVVGNAVFEPFGNLAWVQVQTDGFTETGADAGLSGSSDQSSTGFGTLGLRAATSILMSDGKVLQPRGSIAWQTAFGDLSPQAQLAFLSAPNAGFSVVGVPVASSTALIELGTDLVLSPDAVVGLTYFGQFGDGVSSNGLQAKFSWQF